MTRDSYQDHRTPRGDRMFKGQPIISDQITKAGLEVVWHELERILQANVEGHVVEFGCYIGTSSLFIRRLLNQYDKTDNPALLTGGAPWGTPASSPTRVPWGKDGATGPVIVRAGGEREFHVYDSFEGLPEKRAQDANAAGVDFEAGKLYVSKKELLQQFHNAHLQPPITHKGWFNEISPAEVPEPIAFAFLDGDFYDSIISSLRLVYPKMAEGGTILIDDYQRETLPGVERAIRDFFQGKPLRLRAQANIAIIEL